MPRSRGRRGPGGLVVADEHGGAVGHHDCHPGRQRAQNGGREARVQTVHVHDIRAEVPNLSSHLSHGRRRPDTVGRAANGGALRSHRGPDDGNVVACAAEQAELVSTTRFSPDAAPERYCECSRSALMGHRHDYPPEGPPLAGATAPSRRTGSAQPRTMRRAMTTITSSGGTAAIATPRRRLQTGERGEREGEPEGEARIQQNDQGRLLHLPRRDEQQRETLSRRADDRPERDREDQGLVALEPRARRRG